MVAREYLDFPDIPDIPISQNESRLVTVCHRGSIQQDGIPWLSWDNPGSVRQIVLHHDAAHLLDQAQVVDAPLHDPVSAVVMLAAGAALRAAGLADEVV